MLHIFHKELKILEKIYKYLRCKKEIVSLSTMKSTDYLQLMHNFSTSFVYNDMSFPFGFALLKSVDLI